MCTIKIIARMRFLFIKTEKKNQIQNRMLHGQQHFNTQINKKLL